MPVKLQSHPFPPLLTPQDPTPSQLDPPTELYIPSLPLLLALLLALGLYLFCKSSANRFNETIHEDKHSEALTALMAIFTPTRSSWPSDILDATRRASVSRQGRGSVSSVGSGSGRGEIRLGFSMVYEHILNGDLELQPTASVDLVKAMLFERDGMEVDGWKIKVVVEWRWLWRVSLWIVKGLGSRLVNLSELWDDDVYKNSDLLERTKVPSLRLIYALDVLPTSQHGRFARQLHKMLHSSRPTQLDLNGTKEDVKKQATVTFSTISAPSISLSTITLCGLPFFLRVPLGEPTPVLLGLRRAVKSLSSSGVSPGAAAGEGRLVVTSVEDTSERFATALTETIKHMEGDADFRQRMVDELGIKGWRRGLFCIELEAALYKAGLMKRWEVLVGVS